MSTDINLNQNTADCIKEVNNIGSTLYTNICSGSETLVSWGLMQWAGWGIVAAFFGIIAIGILFITGGFLTVGFLKSIGKDI